MSLPVDTVDSLNADMQDVLYDALYGYRFHDSAEALEVLAPIVDRRVAAELRRLLADTDPALIFQTLTRRANELDGGVA